MTPAVTSNQFMNYFFFLILFILSQVNRFSQDFLNTTIIIEQKRFTSHAFSYIKEGKKKNFCVY